MSRTRTLAAVVAATLSLVACGGESELDLVSQVSGAANATLGADTAKTSFTTTGLGEEITFEGAFDFAAKKAELSAPASAMGFGTGDTTFLYDFSEGLVMYIALPSESQIGAPWLEMDLVAAMAQAGIDADLAEIIQSQSSDPTSGLHFLRGASEVTELGTEVIRQTETRHLEVVIDLDELVGQTPEGARDDMARLVELYTVDTITVEVWLDDDDRVRRFRQDIDYSTFELPGNPDLGPLEGRTQTVEAEYYDFGTAVDVQLPTPDETITFEEFMARISGG